MRYDPVADPISCDRYKKIRSYLHVADDIMKYNPENFIKLLL